MVALVAQSGRVEALVDDDLVTTNHRRTTRVDRARVDKPAAAVEIAVDVCLVIRFWR